MAFIGEDLFHFQASLVQSGTSFEDFIRDNYVEKWVNETLYSAMKIRTSYVTALVKLQSTPTKSASSIWSAFR